MLLTVILGTSYCYGIMVIGWLCMLALVDLFILFYAKGYDHFGGYCLSQLGIFILLIILLHVIGGDRAIELFPILFLPDVYLMILWMQKRRKLILFACVFLFTSVFLYLGFQGYGILMECVTLTLLYLLESMYHGLSQNFKKDTTEFQNQIMLHHYEEVKSVYLNMRGWRHDYHNHIQTLKAYFSLNQYDRMEEYLGELEKDLKRVDQLVKSGNLMVDAILNSKLSLAGTRGIQVSCKVIVPEHISISDIDICVILGNLLDNAIEACAPIEEEKRFIRIYGDIVHSQFYFSIFNSAVEEPRFNQKNYISEKRGEHGHGMKRVRLIVDKYEGYLNLKNEPGVFASEIMIPLESC
ncbi:hypothetical protein bsdtb5_31330 [Anaeromicropila herbilytica]|uniref:ATP-binding protein n=1 Tax=Anaeromicropila herbilytica TaxID=2785025 RepID=A0A7R7IF70_9FIRM|nr:hypothetical protein bsdtb5_31330 [Anaeromicropila herbilytica]